MKNTIPAKTALRLLENTTFMNGHHGVAFNGMITLNFEQIGATCEAEAQSALTKLNEAVADRIYRHGQRYSAELKFPHFFMYAHEHVESHGHHVHELIVLPPGLDAEFDGWLQAWVRRNYGKQVDPKAIHYKGRYYKDVKAQADQQARLVRYILKSAENACIAAKELGATTLHAVLGIEKPTRAYAAPVRRVAGTSQNIGFRARLATDYAYPETLEEALTDVHLQAYHRRVWAEEFRRQLRSIDL